MVMVVFLCRSIIVEPKTSLGSLSERFIVFSADFTGVSVDFSGGTRCVIGDPNELKGVLGEAFQQDSEDFQRVP